MQVRYQSRKRLAEQRPRVKGQFVRQVHNNDNSAPDAVGGGSWNSSHVFIALEFYTDVHQLGLAVGC